jgi:F0F1-type ATP synthase assembly protein I
LALTVVVLFFAGRWLDGKFGTAPWMMLGGIFIGTVGGIIKFVMSAMEAGRQEDRNEGKKPGS